MPASWTVARNYLERIRFLEWAIASNNRAIEYHRSNSGLHGQRISEKITGTKPTDRLEFTAIESMEMLERITANNELFKADLAAEIRPLERLSKADQALLRRHFIEDLDPYRESRKPKAGKSRRGCTQADIDQVMAPYRALERLYDLLPESWKDSLPKAI